MTDSALAVLRDKVDEIDVSIRDLMLRRLKVIDGIVRVKKANKIPVFVPGREDQILERLVSSVDSKYASYIRDLFVAILDISKQYQIERKTSAE